MLPETCLSQGGHQSPPTPSRPPSLAPTHPSGMGMRWGKQLSQCPGPMWRHVSASPGGGEPGHRVSDAQPRRGASPGALVRGAGGNSGMGEVSHGKGRRKARGAIEMAGSWWGQTGNEMLAE